jgi:hypothetical protein
MTAFALLLMTVSALMHASWNYLTVVQIEMTDAKITDPLTGKQIRLTSYAACAG